MPTILDVVCRITGMGFAAIARVTEERWIACGVLDHINFGLKPGGELEVESTICHEIRQSRQAVIINHVAEDSVYRDHHTPRKYGFQSYISVPIFLTNGRFWGTLCSIDPKPAQLNTPQVVGTFKLFAELIAFHYEAASQLAGAQSKLSELQEHAENLEARVETGAAALDETIGELEAFSYSISHDMRAPLRAMQSFSKILIEDCGEQLNATGKQYLYRINSAAGRLDGLIQDVLIYSRVARADLPLKPVELETFLQDILQTYPLFQPPAAKVELTGHFPVVLAIPAILTQCISNILDNAVKFVAPGVTPHIRVWSEDVGDGKTRLYFKDNGLGIDSESHQSIFGIFQQVSKNFEGSGIGLSIVKKGAERMGGSVGLTSESGKGSAFWLDLRKSSPERT